MSRKALYNPTQAPQWMVDSMPVEDGLLPVYHILPVPYSDQVQEALVHPTVWYRNRPEANRLPATTAPLQKCFLCHFGCCGQRREVLLDRTIILHGREDQS